MERPKETPIDWLVREFRKVAFFSDVWPKFEELAKAAKDMEAFARIPEERPDQKRQDLSKF